MFNSLHPMDCSMPGFPVLHYLPGFAQTHAHWISDAIKPFHPLSSPYPAFNLSQHKYILSQFGKAGAQNASLRAKRKKKKVSAWLISSRASRGRLLLTSFSSRGGSLPWQLATSLLPLLPSSHVLLPFILSYCLVFTWNILAIFLFV